MYSAADSVGTVLVTELSQLPPDFVLCKVNVAATSQREELPLPAAWRSPALLPAFANLRGAAGVIPGLDLN